MPSNNLSSKLVLFLKDNAEHDSFPEHGTNYYERFVRIDEHLNAEVHPTANTGPGAKERIWLTDHGPRHISTVIRRASDLVCKPDCVLTPYEAYILLLLCHFHDVGNLFGRKEHEKRVQDVVFRLDSTLVGSNTFEKRMICDAATAHGGYVDEDETDKDTIGKLNYERSSKPTDPDVKKLAAILRFADELADDKSRTDPLQKEALAEEETVKKQSEIFHEYASVLNPIEVKDSRVVEARYELSLEAATKQFYKKGELVYLFDEIKSRSFKMHRELVYCSRFMVPDVLIDQIDVRVEVCNNDFSQVLGEIRYSMSQQGYPEHPSDLNAICPTLSDLNGSILATRVAGLDSTAKRSRYQVPIDLTQAKGVQSDHVIASESRIAETESSNHRKTGIKNWICSKIGIGKKNSR